MNRRAAAALLAGSLATGCDLYLTELCAPCVAVCGSGLECIDGLCTSPVAVCKPVCDDGLRAIGGECRGPVDVAMGDEHACSVWPDGRVACWGLDTDLARGFSGARWVARPQLLDTVEGAVAVAAGPSHTCVLRSDATVACWGALGDARGAAPRGVPMPGGFAPVSIFAGDRFGCALDAGGRAECFGRSAEGQLDPPDRVFTTLALGDSFGCGLSAGELVCWGRRPSGIDAAGARVEAIAAGDDFVCWRDATGEVACSAGIDPAPTGGPFVAIAAAGNHACVATEDDRPRCWGSVDPVAEITSVSPDLPRDGRRIVMGRDGGCLLADDAPLDCWGVPGGGLLADDRAAARRPVQVVEGGATAIAADALSTCARLEDGRVECWGLSRELGRGNLATGGLAPAAVTMVQATTIDVGYRTCAGSSSGLSCWGDGRAAPQRLTGFETGVRDVAAGAFTVCAAMAGGTLKCSGSAEEAQRGEPNQMARIGQIAAGTAHFCAIDVDDAVWCWGRNDTGQVDGRGPASDKAPALPVRVPGATNMARVAAGAQHSCAIDVDGALHCWGRDAPVARIPGVGDAVALAARDNFTCIVHRGGAVSCFGTDSGHRFGPGADLGGEGRPVEVATPRPIAGIDDAVDVAVGADHVCALRDGGAVSCWGSDRWSVSSGRAALMSSPVRVPAPQG